MKKILFLGTSFLAVALFLLFIFYKKNSIKGPSVALFVPACHPAMDEIVEGFCSELRVLVPTIHYTIYNGQGNKTLMQSQAEMITASGYDLVFTIGNSTSQLIHGLVKKRQLLLPHIFTAVDDPIEKNLVESLAKPGANVTGVITLAHFEQQIEYLLMAKPQVQSILLAYDPAHPSNAADIEKLKQLLQEKQIRLALCPIHQTGEIKQKVPLMLDGIDAVLILKDHLLVMGVDLLVQLCEQRSIPLYCSDLNSADKGAALAFGIYERDYGVAAVDAAYQIIVNKKDAGLIPIKEVDDLHFKINLQATALQGITLDKLQLQRLNSKGTIISNVSEHDSEMISLLQKYIAIKTVHPCSDAYRAVIDLFVNQANADGIEHTVIELNSGFPMLVLSLKGANTTLPTLLLNHHMDVVRASEDEWQHPPFSGTIKDGYIYGRGVQDMKGVGVIHYAALRDLKKNGIVPQRSLYLAMVPGEECGGFDGTGSFIKTDFFKQMNVGYVLDEGVPSGTSNTIALAIDERSPLQLQISVGGDSAHASKLMHHNPIHTLISLLHDFKKMHDDSVINALHEDPGLHSSYHVTSLTAGNGLAAITTIPATAQAIVDIRVAPNDSIDQMLNFVDSHVKQYNGASYKILAVAREKNNSKNKSYLRNCLEKIITNKGYLINTIVFEGASDMRFYRELGIEAVGCSPFDDKPLLHAVDECLSLKSLYKGYEIIKALLYEI